MFHHTLLALCNVAVYFPNSQIFLFSISVSPIEAPMRKFKYLAALGNCGFELNGE